MQNTVKRLFGYKSRANDALLRALANLDEESSVVELAVKALSHAYVVDRIFAAHIRRKAHGYTSANLTELPTLKELSAGIRGSDRDYIDMIALLDDAQLAEEIDFTFTDGAEGRMSREEMLLHVVTHGVGHRGQVSAVMLLNGLTPAKDGFTTYLHEAEGLRRRRAA
jgi:uncharacterized damage-inducible protein DinB